MPRFHVTQKSFLSKWREMGEIFPFLHGGFMRHEAVTGTKSGFEEIKAVSLGIGILRQFQLV
ncbi:MAG: hypothetical protein KGI33_10990 [Thaumarchaeota archaeon]|nr:hypothetical protein [Nitrososphaerota archaeon]